ncbi:MAG: DUF1232 domain-containing protein [Synechococcales cyanobacterium M58_A2018_015]|nr:DUF1232 domain-containing protein [Synechococcales cyanobacterium M58_A2018_015]
MKFLTRSIYNFVLKFLRNSKYRWLIVVASLLYLVSPLDISPDVIPVLGWLDDGMVITLLASELTQVLLEHRQTRKKDASTSSTVNSTADLTA